MASSGEGIPNFISDVKIFQVTPRDSSFICKVPNKNKDGDKQHVPFRGQTICPFRVTNMSLLGEDKKYADFRVTNYGSLSVYKQYAPFRVTNNGSLIG